MRRWLLSTYLNGGDHNLDTAPEAKFDGDAGGGGERTRQVQAKLLCHCKKTEEIQEWNAQQCESVQEDG